jgi:hypothetical protein
MDFPSCIAVQLIYVIVVAVCADHFWNSEIYENKTSKMHFYGDLYFYDYGTCFFAFVEETKAKLLGKC